jgi:hypothetical protein
MMDPYTCTSLRVCTVVVSTPVRSQQESVANLVRCTETGTVQRVWVIGEPRILAHNTVATTGQIFLGTSHAQLRSPGVQTGFVVFQKQNTAYRKTVTHPKPFACTARGK